MDQRGLAFTMLGVVIGLIAAVVGWWAMFMAPAALTDVGSTLGDPRFPAAPRLVTAAVVLGTEALALLLRPAALAMAAFGMLAIGYSLLVFMDLVPAFVSPDGLTVEGFDPVLETLYAVVVSGLNVPLLALGGIWVGIAMWWLVGREVRPWGGSRLALPALLGVGLTVAAWWLLPVVTRAMVLMLTEGRDASSPLPALLNVALAAGLVWLALRWPGVGLGAAAAALGFAAYSIVVSAPEPGLIPGGAPTWTLSLGDVLAIIRSTAFRATTIELTAACGLIAASHLLVIGPALARRAPTEPATAG